MKYIKLFESFNLQDMLDKVDDISAYIPSPTTHFSKWCLPDFDSGRLLDEDAFTKYKGNDKKHYIRYYTIWFNEMSNFFEAESDIRSRSKFYGFRFFVINFGRSDHDCCMILFTEEDYDKIDMRSAVKNMNDKGWDLLEESDVKIERDEFDIIYEDDDIMAVRPKTYKAAIKYSSDTHWKSAFKKNKDWIEKYMTPGSYYGGTNWYKSTTVKKKVETWWSKLLKLPPKQSEVELKEFFNDFPRYLMYMVIFKRIPVDDDMSKLYLLYDVSRGEYGSRPGDVFGWGASNFGNGWLDSAHNQLKICKVNGKRVTLTDIHKRHYMMFNRAFREIENNVSSEKDRMYDLLGFWSEKGSDYMDDALIFIRSNKEPDRLQVTKPSLVTKTDKGVSWTRLGYYDDPNFDYWDIDNESPDEKVAPNNGRGFEDYHTMISNDVKKLRDALEDGWKL